MALQQKKTKDTTTLGFAVGILAMIVVAIVAVQSSNRFADSAVLTDQSYTARALLLRVSQAGSRAKNDNRSYILSGNSSYLQQYQVEKAQITELMAQMRSIRSDAETQKDLDGIETELSKSFADMDRAAALYKSAGRDEAIKFVSKLEDPEVTIRSRQQFANLEQAEANRLAQYSSQTTQNKSIVISVVPLGLAIAAIAVGLAAYFVQRDARRIKNAESALNASSEMQRAILNSANVAVFSFDKAGTIISFNRTAERMLGYRAEDMVGLQKPTIFHDVFELKSHAQRLNVDPGMDVFTKPAIASGAFESEWTFIRKEGSRFPVQLSIAPLASEDGEISGFVGIASDLTEKAEARAKLTHYVQELEEAREDLAVKNKLLEEFAEDLKVSRDEAVSATNTKSEFLANMSHEIRTPLNGVLGTTHLLLNTELSDKQRSYVQLIHRSAESLLSILNDILDLSKMEAGKMSMENEPFDLRETIEDVCEQFASVAHQKGLDLNLLVPPSAPIHLLGDAVRIRQVVTNLVANAIKFTATGEVDVKASVIREDSGSARFRISVEDSGIGIPRDKLRSIFESFAQADGNTARRFGGTGLGLAISQQLVELMHGQIGVDSELDKGSQFWFEVTFEKQSEDQIESDRRDLGGITVLVADDNDTNRMVVQGLLESWNCKVEVAKASKEAIDMIATTNYDCAVLDMLMPGDDGIEIARRIRKSKRTRDLPLVMLSSSFMHQNEAEAQQLFQAVLSKPVRSSLFYEAVAKAVKMGVQTGEIATRNSQDQLKSVRVLVVEDNPINQLVVTEMLKSWGCTVVAVDNGRKAADRLTVDSFDIVLMDVQMPEMDGLEATKAIRRREAGSDNHIPIVAMTANAMKGDEERCLKAGMDAYLSKPIQPQKLADTMAHYAGHEVIIEEEVAPLDVVEDDSLPVFDLEQLNQTTSGKSDLQKRILERYMESLGPQTAILDDSIRLMDRGQIKGAAHSLKGSSWTVGALAIADVFRQIESGSESLSSGDLQDLMLLVETDVENIRKRIQDFLREVAKT